jgi:inner membrane protein
MSTTQSLAVAGLLDESDHLATAALALAFVRHPPTESLLVGLALGGVAIDADHLPVEFGSSILTDGTGRPYTHSLMTVAAAAIAAGLTSGRVFRFAAGVSLGLASHLLRDMGTGGVPLAWPFSKENVEIPYLAYAALLSLAAVVAWARLRVRSR